MLSTDDAAADHLEPGDAAPTSDVRWLSESEQRAWRSTLRGITTILGGLDADLLQYGISLSEYEILAILSEAPEREMRMSALADAVAHSRSRLTHAANRLARNGWVERRSVPGDGRGVLLHLTETGYEAVVRFAPHHINSVRERILDVLGPDEFATLGAAMHAIYQAEPTPAAREHSQG